MVLSRNVLNLTAFLALSPFALQAGFIDGAVITTGNTSLGVNPHGHLNYFPTADSGGLPTLPAPNPGVYGVHYAGIGDAISPGCYCEGWGVYADGASAWASVDNGGVSNLGAAAYTFAANAFNSSVFTTNSNLRVDQVFQPSLAADIFQVQVTLTNTSSTIDYNDVRYLRVMDWDVPPTEFNELVTHSGVVANLTGNGGNVITAHNNGFEFAGGFTGTGSAGGAIDPLSVNTDFDKLGPDDHGSFFEFGFGPLNAEESRTFYIYYGAAPTRADALTRLGSLGVNLYSLGQPDVTDPDAATTFVFAFGGVGGVAPGSSPESPLLPGVTETSPFGTPVYSFINPPPQAWFDPPFVDTWEFDLGVGEFLGVDWQFIPFGDADILVWDGSAFVLAGSHTGTGATTPFLFGSGVTRFRISGLDATSDAADPLSFPVWLNFTEDAADLTMVGIPGTSAVPEPGTYLMVGFGVLSAVYVRRRKRLS
jgi:hypothetical protein